MSDFSELLQEAEKLTNELGGSQDLPKVERSIRQVLEASTDLYSRVAQTGAKDIQANLLLGAKGVDLPKIAQKLESLSTKRTFEPILPVTDLDIYNTLENETRTQILSIFDSGYNKMLSFTYDMSWEHQQSEWKQEKRKILNAMSTSSGAAIEIGTNKHLTINMDRPTYSAGNLGPLETIYVSKIIDYNKAVSKGAQKPNLVNIFCSIVNEFKDQKVTDMWEIIKYMTQLPPFPKTDDPIKTRNTNTFIDAMVKQAKSYLEDRYKTYMNNIINDDLVHAIRGGIPGTYHLVRSFVGLRLQGEYLGLQDGLVEDKPLWPMVYYCLRSGDISAAIYCLKKSGLPEFKDMILLLEAKFNGATVEEIHLLEETIKFSYRRHIRNDTDPFKRMVWSILGCCDINDEHSEVARTADDYLWLKLSLVRALTGEEDSIKYKDLQHVILEEYGETHYNAFNQPHLYFQMLALTGQFEAAFEFLSRTEKYKIHGLHMALALNELYMLGGPLDTGAPLMSIDPMDEKPSCRLNVPRFVMLYVKKFELVCPNEALHYFYFLRNYTSPEGENLFKVSVAYLAVETKQYELILGKVQSNGIRTKCLIDQFTYANITCETIAQLTAENLLKKGLFEEAIDLFDIANNQEEVLKLNCSILSRTVHLENEPNSLRSRIAEKATNFANRFLREGYKTSPTIVNSFIKLKELITFFNQYHDKNYPQASKTLHDLQLVPQRMDEVDDRVKTFKNYHQDLCKVFPDIVLAAMNMIFAQYQKLKSNTEYIPRFRDETMEVQLKTLREQAKCLTNFTGMLPYRMPGDTNSRLMQMEILMH
ncbi:nuclear pore complex protein Nup93-1 [Diabrotica undecimpunctata]|uniref:nuclear pore complex protein Nup93-1 n=1 Tax=Diabrotica undecimpunctata TaxID=50387 RepID=UPI003B63EA65